MRVDLSIVIVSYNTKEILKNCLDSIIESTKDVSHEIIVVDNASKDGSVEYLNNLSSRLKDFILVKNSENLGFAKANNIGTQKASGRYILFLNSDTIIGSEVLREVVYWMDRNPKVGISSCKLKNKDGSVQETGGYFPTLLRVFSWLTIQDLPFVDRFIEPFHPLKELSIRKGGAFYGKDKELDWVSGAFMMVRSEVFKSGIHWDEDYFMYTEDVDFCYRVKKAGWKVYYLSEWDITHLKGASSKKGYSILKEFDGVKIFYKKHYPSWQLPFLRMFLKIGALGRVILFAVLGDRQKSKIYVEAFKKA